MPSIEITDEQYERFTAVKETLTAAHAGKYASVHSTDVMAYLLDVADATDDPVAAFDNGAETTAGSEAATVTDSDSGGDATDETDQSGSSVDVDGDSDDEGDTPTSASSGPGMLDLLDDHGDKWREADGEARYEVDLPDGSTETARTRDDVKAILFKNYR